MASETVKNPGMDKPTLLLSRCLWQITLLVVSDARSNLRVYLKKALCLGVRPVFLLAATAIDTHRVFSSVQQQCGHRRIITPRAHGQCSLFFVSCAISLDQSVKSQPSNSSSKAAAQPSNLLFLFYVTMRLFKPINETSDKGFFRRAMIQVADALANTSNQSCRTDAEGYTWSVHLFFIMYEIYTDVSEITILQTIKTWFRDREDAPPLHPRGVVTFHVYRTRLRDQRRAMKGRYELSPSAQNKPNTRASFAATATNPMPPYPGYHVSFSVLSLPPCLPRRVRPYIIHLGNSSHDGICFATAAVVLRESKFSCVYS